MLVVEGKKSPGKDVSVTGDESCEKLTSAKENSNSNIITLEPFSPLIDQGNGNNQENKASNDVGQNPHQNEQTETRRKQKKKYIPDPTFMLFESIFGPDNWSRFLILESESEISNIKLEKLLLQTSASNDMSFRSKDHKIFTIKTTNKEQSKAYLNLTELNGHRVKVYPHAKLNSIQGTVVLPQDLETSINDKTLLESLQFRYSNVQNLESYKVRNKRFPDRQMQIAKISFSGDILPNKILIMGQNREVRPYIPKPLQCSKCSKFGHSELKCRNEAVCAYCSSDQHPTKWQCGTPLCINCKQNHHARSKTCQYYIYNTELKLLMTRTGLSVREAKLELKMRGIHDPARKKTFNNVTIGNIAKSVTVKHNQELSHKQQNKCDVEANNLGSDFIEVQRSSKFKVSRLICETAPNGNSEETIVEIHAPEDNKETPTLDNNSEIKVRKVNKIGKPLLTTDQNSIIDINPYEILNNIDQNFEDNNSVADMEITNVKDSKKRGRENGNSPKQNKTCKVNEETEAKESVKPKIRNVTSGYPSTDEEVSPSPVIVNTILPPKKDTVNFTSRKHASNCGCNNCFENECRKFSNLTRDNLLNTVKHFMNNRKNGVTEDLASHSPLCMCVKHLTTYYKKSPTTIDDYFEKFNTKYQKYKSPHENQNSADDNTSQTSNTGNTKIKTRYNRISSKSSSSINLQNLTTLT